MWLRVSGLLMRYLYLYRRSPARLMGVVFWPVMDLLVWGFLTVYLTRTALPVPVLFLLGGVIFWDIFYSAQQAITLSITEEIWVRNILNISSPPSAPTSCCSRRASSVCSGRWRAVSSSRSWPASSTRSISFGWGWRWPPSSSP